MALVLYTPVDEDKILASLGEAEYSYFFVYQAFLNLLKKRYTVIDVGSNHEKIDTYYESGKAFGEPVICLAFTPPHKIPEGIRCPTIPVFAWEFDTFPHDLPGGKEEDWLGVIADQRWAITHSCYVEKNIRKSTDEDIQIISVPSPVFDNFSTLYRPSTPPFTEAPQLSWDGILLDSSEIDINTSSHAHWHSSIEATLKESLHSSDCQLRLEGLVYLSILNPNDGRKNWQDMLHAFCWAFKDNANVTLVFKITHHTPNTFMAALIDELFKLGPITCRVVAIHGYLSTDTFNRLIGLSHYVVNSSTGEGQCLPLMEAMSAGKPAISPAHTGMADYISSQNSFIVTSAKEPAFWPHDPNQKYTAMQYRISWQSLYANFLASADVFHHKPKTYRAMAKQAHETLKAHCSRQAVMKKLSGFIDARLKVEAITQSAAKPERRYLPYAIRSRIIAKRYRDYLAHPANNEETS